MAMTQERAISILRGVSANRKTDFHKLRQEQVAQLLEHADLHKYRAPRNANGSRARCFFAMLQRKAYPVYELEHRLYADYGTGWEIELTEETRFELKMRLKEYRRNAPQYRHRIASVKVRVNYGD